MDIEIKRLKQEEIFKILRENDLIFTPPLSTVVDLLEYSQKLATHAYFLLCYMDKVVAGVIAFYKNDEAKQLYIPYLITRLEYQGQGVASAMIQYMVNKFRDEYTSIALEVNKTNQPAFHLYSKMNFIINEDRGNKYLMVSLL